MVGKVAVTPVKPAPLPKNEPLNEPERFEEAPVNWIEEAPLTTEPLSVKLESTNLPAPLSHLVTMLLVN